MQAAPQIIILAIGAAEKRAEAVELDALERRIGAARADRAGIVGGDAIDADRIELVDAFSLKQGQSGDIEERETKMR